MSAAISVIGPEASAKSSYSSSSDTERRSTRATPIESVDEPRRTEQEPRTTCQNAVSLSLQNVHRALRLSREFRDTDDHPEQQKHGQTRCQSWQRH